MAFQIGNIGSRGDSPRLASYSRQSASPEDFGSGIGTAMRGLGAQTGEFASFMAQRKREQEEMGLATSWNTLQGEASRDQIAAQQGAGPGAQGFTEAQHQRNRERVDQFVEGISDPELRARYQAMGEEFVQSTTTNAFIFENERAGAYFRSSMADLMNSAQSRIYADPSLLDQEFETLSAQIANSTLTAPEKQELQDEVFRGLVGASYEHDVEVAMANDQPIGPEDGSDVVAAGLSAPQRGVLNAIAGGESGSLGYNARYPSTTFEDFSDHPRIYETITSGPNAGDKSSAAGRYGFIASTWDDEVARMRAEGIVIEDFRPVNQDRVALHYAQRVYASYARENDYPPQYATLEAAIASGDREALVGVRHALANTGGVAVWEGVADGHMTDDEFIELVTGQRGIGGGGTEDNTAPDVMADPRYAELPFELRMQMHQDSTRRVNAARAAEAEAARAAEGALYSSLVSDLQNGVPGAAENIQDALASGQITDIEDRDDLINRTKEEYGRQQDASAVTAGLASGQTFSEDNREQVESYYASTGVTRGLRAGDPAAAEALVTDSARMGYIPSSMIDILQSSLSSANAAQQAFAAQTLVRLYEQDPTGFARNATEAQAGAAVMLSRQLRYASSPQEALTNYNAMNDPALASQRRALTEQFDKMVKDGEIEFDPANVLDADAPLSNFASMRLGAEYEGLYRDGYIQSQGDEDAAKEYADRMIAYNWAPDPISGALMEHSPSAAGTNVRTLGGTYDWIEPMVRAEIGADEGTSLTLQWDTQTAQEIARGEVPTYTAITINAEGQISIPTGEDGRPRRIRMEPSQPQIRESEWNTEVKRLEGQLEVAEQLAGRYIRTGLATDPQATARVQRLQSRLDMVKELGPEGWPDSRTQPIIGIPETQRLPRIAGEVGTPVPGIEPAYSGARLGHGITRRNMPDSPPEVQ